MLPQLPATVAVVLVNYNGLSDTLECLASLDECQPSAEHVIVVDNASAESPSNEILARHPTVSLVMNSENEGWAGGNNRGIERALELKADLIVLLNNDTIVSRIFVSFIQRVSEANPDFGVFGPTINEYDVRSKVQTEGCLFFRGPDNEFFRHEPAPSAGTDLTPVDIVNGCCMVVRKQVFEKIGLIDERFFLIHEESDFCLRALESGYRLGVSGESHVWHKHSATFARSGKPVQRYYNTRNLFLLLRKHPQVVKRRGRVTSYLSLWKHLAYMYVQERDSGRPADARSVMQGIVDASFNRFGPRPVPSGRLPGLLNAILFAPWKLLRLIRPERRP